MSGIEHPYFLVTLGDEWLTAKTGSGPFAALAFATVEDARTYIAHVAAKRGIPVESYRILQYMPVGLSVSGCGMN